MKHLWTLQGVYKTHFGALGMFCKLVARRLFSRLYATRKAVEPAGLRGLEAAVPAMVLADTLQIAYKGV